MIPGLNIERLDGVNAFRLVFGGRTITTGTLKQVEKAYDAYLAAVEEIELAYQDLPAVTRAALSGVEGRRYGRG